MANPHSLPPNVVEALRRGDKIEAIKLLREVTRVGLAEAKTAIDRHGASGAAPPKQPAQTGHGMHSTPHTWRPGGLSPGEVPRSSSGPAGIAILLAVAVLAAWAF